jgi:membrane associated rhomboid family serine protease
MSSEPFRPSRFSMLPPVVKNLLILNGLFFLATFGLGSAFNIDLTDILGLHYFAAQDFKPYQIITYMFMHGSFMHIFFNMFALWMFGYVLENFWGPKRFLIYYVVTGIGAAIVHYAVFYFELRPVLEAINTYLADPGHLQLEYFLAEAYVPVREQSVQAFVAQYNTLAATDMQQAVQYSVQFVQEYREHLLNAPVVVGASGAVFGILLAFGMIFPNTTIYIYFAIPIKAKWFVILYGALELVSGITNSGSNVAHFAHLGGMLFGLVLILLWKRQARRNRNYPHEF